MPQTKPRNARLFLQRRFIAPLWVLLWAIIVTGELLPAESTPIELLSATQISDKVIHFSAYMALGFLPALAFRARTALWCIVIVELVSIGLEFAQLLVPGRSCEFGDAVANTIGIGSGVLVAIAFRRLLKRPRADR